MVKTALIFGIMLAGIIAAVLVIQKPALLNSFGYDVIDFVASFHSKEGDAQYNPNLDVFKDGTINVMDVLKDRYEQEATRVGIASNSGQLISTPSAEASRSAI